MSSTKGLRLGPLPRQEVTKLTFLCPISLKINLERYASLHAQTYGEAVDALTLIPHMLEAFMARDRGFTRSNASTAIASAKEKPRQFEQERVETSAEGRTIGS